MPHRHPALAKTLAAYATADTAEAAHLAAMLALLATAAAPLARDHFVPGHFTASAFVLSPDHQQALLILHSKLHRWLQPGGHIEPDDTDLVAAARREVAEETGLVGLQVLSPLFDVDVHAIPPSTKHPGHLHFDLRVLFVADQLGGMAGSDAQALQWVPLDRVHTLETDASVLRAVGKLRQRRTAPR